MFPVTETSFQNHLIFLICIFLMISYVKHFFHRTFGHLYVFYFEFIYFRIFNLLHIRGTHLWGTCIF